MAISEINDGKSRREISIPITTLERYMKTNKIVPTKGHSILLGKDLELELVDNMLAFERRNFGMTIDDVHEPAFELRWSTFGYTLLSIYMIN